jgi:hypothetical protein
MSRVLEVSDARALQPILELSAASGAVENRSDMRANRSRFVGLTVLIHRCLLCAAPLPMVPQISKAGGEQAAQLSTLFVTDITSRLLGSSVQRMGQFGA